MNNTLKARQISLFFIAFLPITKLFMMPSVIAKISAEDMWISILYNILFDFLTLSLIVMLTRNKKTDYFDILEKSFGKIPAKIILSFYVLFFMCKCIIPLCEQKDYIVKTLYITSPDSITFAPVFIVFFYLSIKNLRVIGRCADVAWFFTLLGLILIFGLSVPNIDLETILPIGGSGMSNILKGSYSGLLWFGDCIYFMFFLGEFKKEKNGDAKILLGYAVSLLIVLIFGIIFWSTFSSIAFRQRFALTEISKYMTIINNVGRFDYIAIFFIIFADVFALAFPFYFSSLILNRIFPIKHRFIYPILLCAAQLSFMLFFSEYYYFFETALLNYGGIFCIMFSYVIPIISICIFKFKKKENLYETSNG